MRFEVLSTDSRSAARLGAIHTARGTIATPAFMPCASRAVVRACLPGQVAATGTGMMICNAYHLLMRPGAEVIERLGGLHRFMGWPGLLATDSGGFQVFSLGRLAKITEKGVSFRSEVDGRRILLTPESSIEVQTRLGADLIMCFDECAPYPCEYEYARDSMEMTLRWAARCRQAHSRAGQALFGIVQGSVYPDLRERSARETVVIGFDGYAIGGLSVGESRRQMLEALDAALPHLPADRPRYAMGVGTPLDIVQCAARGVDIFDCVLPTRNARHGAVLTAAGTLKINTAACREDDRPLEPGCDCPACTSCSRAYIHHLLRIKDAAAWTLLSLHNLRFYARLMERVREAIAAGALDELQRQMRAATVRDTEAEGDSQ